MIHSEKTLNFQIFISSQLQTFHSPLLYGLFPVLQWVSVVRIYYEKTEGRSQKSNTILVLAKTFDHRHRQSRKRLMEATLSLDSPF